MEYDEAYQILDTNADSNKLFLFILKGDNKSAVEYVKQVTNCDETVAKAIVLDLSDGLITEKTNELSNNQTNISIQSNVPHCPICQSTDIKKITTTKRAVKTALFGIVGAVDDAGKTYKCNNCGSKF